MSRPEKLNVAVIGLGMGSNHLDAYHKYYRSNAVAICDLLEHKLESRGKNAEIPPERRYTDWKKLFADAKKLDLHAVSVALPNYLHAPVVIAAFKAGLHVLCEKPIALNAKLAQAMLDASVKARRKLMINFSYRFHDQSQALKRYVETGAIGDIYWGRTAWHRRRGMPGVGGGMMGLGGVAEGMGLWFTDKEKSGGGPIIDLGVHRLDMAMWLMGNPRPVTVSGSTFNGVAHRVAKAEGKKYTVEDLGCALIRFDNGATLMLEASWAGFSEKREEMSTTLLGSTGGIVQRNVGEGYDFEARVFSETSGTLWESRLQENVAPAKSAYVEFVNAVLDDTPVPAPGEHGLAVQLILDAVYKSAATGKEVRIAAK